LFLYALNVVLATQYLYLLTYIVTFRSDTGFKKELP